MARQPRESVGSSGTGGIRIFAAIKIATNIMAQTQSQPTTALTVHSFHNMISAVSEAHDLAEAARLGFVVGERNPNDIDFEAMGGVGRMLVERLDAAIREFETIFEEKRGEG